MYWALIFLSIGFLWFRLIHNLRVEWNTDLQYSYGVLVPWLGLGLAVRRWLSMRTQAGRVPEAGPWARTILIFALLALLYLPTRLVEAATPEWRPIQWLLGIETIGITLIVIRLAWGKKWFEELAFPVCFLFVAIPWPTLVEAPIIQGLTRANVAMVVDLLGWAGVPAVAHGNIIEVSTGLVGIEEACSGIRSFQASLMTGLFLGEFYRLPTAQRWWLIPIGFCFSMMFNVSRMFLLTLLVAHKGLAAIAQYHDPAGITVAVLCTGGLWGVVLFWRRRRSRPNTGQSAPEAVTGQSPSGATTDPGPRPGIAAPVKILCISLPLWLILVETGVQLWYREREARIQPGPQWTLQFPQDNPTLKIIPIDPATRSLLRYDEGRHAAWDEPDGTRWQAFYFNWRPGRVAGYLAKRHTPEICLPAVGLKLISGPQLTMMDIRGVELPVNSYVFDSDEGPIQVFHCRWEAGANREDYVAHESSRFNLVRAIWAGRGNQGQKVLEFVILGVNDPAEAKKELADQLEQMVAVEKPETRR